MISARSRASVRNFQSWRRSLLVLPSGFLRQVRRRSHPLRARPSSNPNLGWRQDQEFPGCKLVRVVFEHGIKVLNLGLEACAWEPKENDARVEEALVEDQVAEIAISDDQNALFVLRDCQDILIGKTVRIFTGYGRNVMAKPAKVSNQPEISALIEQESHTGVASDRAPLGGLG